MRLSTAPISCINLTILVWAEDHLCYILSWSSFKHLGEISKAMNFRVHNITTMYTLLLIAAAIPAISALRWGHWYDEVNWLGNFQQEKIMERNSRIFRLILIYCLRIRIDDRKFSKKEVFNERRNMSKGRNMKWSWNLSWSDDSHPREEPEHYRFF